VALVRQLPKVSPDDYQKKVQTLAPKQGKD
jgi:hypothetical protein